MLYPAAQKRHPVLRVFVILSIKTGSWILCSDRKYVTISPQPFGSHGRAEIGRIHHFCACWWCVYQGEGVNGLNLVNDWLSSRMQSRKIPIMKVGRWNQFVIHILLICLIFHLWFLFLGFEKAKCNICFSYGNFQFVAEELTMFASEQKRKNIIVFLTCLFLVVRKTQPYLFLVLHDCIAGILSA